MALLTVDTLSVDFKVDGKWLPAVTDVSFEIKQGEMLALVGESGCGKSVTCMSLARLLPEPPARYSTGKITFNDGEKSLSILDLPSRQLRDLRGGRIAYIFQEPSVSLNPVYRIGDQIAEAIWLHRPDVADIKSEIIALLQQVGIPEPEERLKCFPHEMSGGMQQRVMIAMALASKPDLLIADEPTTALDVTIQAQILDLLQDIRRETGMAVILVTHNLGIVAEVADRVIVMYAGNTVETASVSDVLNAPLHPYTRALLSAVPKLHHAKQSLNTIPGSVPSPADFPEGCRFCDRCELAKTLSEEDRQRCVQGIPDFIEYEPNHFSRCWYCKSK